MTTLALVVLTLTVTRASPRAPRAQPPPCPGGSLQACIDGCPTTPPAKFQACVEACGKECPSGPPPPCPPVPPPGACTGCGHGCHGSCSTCHICNAKPGCNTEAECLGACSSGGAGKWCGGGGPPPPPAHKCSACGYNCKGSCDTCERCNTKPGCDGATACMGACNSGGNAMWCGVKPPPPPPGGNKTSPDVMRQVHDL